MKGREGSGEECVFVPNMMMVVVVMRMTTFLDVAFFVVILQRTQTKPDKACYKDPHFPLKYQDPILFVQFPWSHRMFEHEQVFWGEF